MLLNGKSGVHYMLTFFMIADATHKPKIPEDYDSIVCAEIPDEKHFPELQRIVMTLMMLGPCGLSNAGSPCMVDGNCSKNYPKDFIETTTAASDGYPQYRRRNDDKHLIHNGVAIDNRHVVPAIHISV